MTNILTPEVKAIVSVDGERVDFISLEINQRMSDHHYFTLVIDHKTLDQSFFKEPEKKLALLYKKVIIDIQPGDDIGKAYTFSGLIDSVKLLTKSGVHGAILLQGKSNSVELDRGKICQTYSNTNLYTIINEITEGTVNLSVINQPDYKADIAFAIQYKETDFEFLSRICHQYNVLYHYNGLDLIVGSYTDYPVVNLTYDLELESLEVCSRLLANEETNYYYRREDHSTIVQDSPKEIDGANYYLQQVSKRADYLTRKRKPNAPIEAYVPDMDSLMNQMERKKVSTGAEMMYIRGSVKTCNVFIGRLLNIKMPKSMGGEEIGTYRVYEVNHRIDQNGRYVCDFEAIPADLKYLPTREVKIPVINPIVCECWRNEDPLGIGRVQVKFPFDERVCDFWMTLMTPDSGGNGAGLGPVSRGYSFVSEVGDSLLISFLDQHLSEPFAMGSVFHGANSLGLGGGKGNHIKSIRDKSSGEFIMNTDEKGNWGIVIRDRRGDVIHIDTAGKNINITAPETVTITAKNIVLNAEEDITSSAGKNISESAGENIVEIAANDIVQSAAKNILESADNKTEIAKEDYTRSSKKSDVYAKEINMTSAKENMLLQSKKTVLINSNEKTNLF